MNLLDNFDKRLFTAKLRRVWALIRKESYELVRDPNSFAIGLVMPVLLVLLFGYGLSLDVTNVPVAIVLEDSSPAARELVSGFQMSPYFHARILASMPAARQLMLERKVDGIVLVPSDFSRRLVHGDANVQVLVHGTDANNARIIQAYAQARSQSGPPAGSRRASRSALVQSLCRTDSGSTRLTTATIFSCPD